MRLFVLTRHAHSTLNVEGRVNGDPSVPVPLTEQGIEEATRLGEQLRNVPFELCVHTRFARTRETALAILGEREVPFLELPLLDDVEIGDLEGDTLEAYRAWKAEHTRADAFPGGESLDDAARRYARGFREVLGRPEECILVVCHEIAVRYALNGAIGSPDLDRPEHTIANATPFLFDAPSLERAISGIERAVESRG